MARLPKSWRRPADRVGALEAAVQLEHGAAIDDAGAHPEDVADLVRDAHGDVVGLDLGGGRGGAAGVGVGVVPARAEVEGLADAEAELGLLAELHRQVGVRHEDRFVALLAGGALAAAGRQALVEHLALHLGGEADRSFEGVDEDQPGDVGVDGGRVVRLGHEGAGHAGRFGALREGVEGGGAGRGGLAGGQQDGGDEAEARGGGTHRFPHRLHWTIPEARTTKARMPSARASSLEAAAASEREAKWPMRTDSTCWLARVAVRTT